MIGDKKVKFFEGFEFKNWGEAIAVLSLMFAAIGVSLSVIIAVFIATA